MQHLNTTPLPHVTIQKIYVNQNNVVVNAYLTVDSSNNSPFWMEEKYFTDFIDINFILIHDGKEFASRLTDPKSRAANMLTTSGQNADVNIRMNWLAPILSKYDHKVITIKEATNRDSENTVSNSGINNSETHTAKNLKDIAFSVEIPITKFTLGSPFKPDTRTLRLYCFSHLNVQSLVSEYNLSAQVSSILKLLEVGGNFKEDLLLETVAERLRVPETIEVLTFVDGTPFNGAYHYHGESNPGPNEYVGWMEGPAQPHMLANARRLKTRTIRYTKTVANFLLEDQFFISNYNGSSALLGAIENNYNSPWTPTASDFDSMFETNGVNSANSSVRVYDPEFQAAASQASFEKQSANSSFQIVHNADHYINAGTNTATHVLDFDINFENLIKSKSKYPFFIDRLNASFGITKEELLREARIINMTIKRYRLSNSPRSNNPVGTADYEVFDTEQIDTLIARTQEPVGSNSITSYYNADGEKTLNENVGSTPEIRKFKVHDHDLSKNVNFGKYAYRVELTVEDSIKKLIVKQVSALRDSMATYQQFLSDATIPYIPLEERFIGYEDPSSRSPDLTAADGNLHFLTNRYTTRFVATSFGTHGPGIMNLVKLFIRLHGFLGTLEPSEASLVSAGLLDTILPSRGGDFDSAIKFADKCKELLSTYEGILLSDNIVQAAESETDALAAQQLVKLGRRIVRTTTSNSIEFKRVISGYATALTPGEAIVSYGLNDDFLNMRLDPVPPPRLRRFDLSLTSGPQVSDGLWIPPDRIAIAQPAARIMNLYNINQWDALDPEQTIQSSAELQTLVDTPIETSQLQAAAISQNVSIESTDYGISGLLLTLPDSPAFSTQAADINTNNTPFKSSDDKSGLTQENQKAVVASSDSYDKSKKYAKDKKTGELEKARSASRNIMKRLEQKIAKSKNKNQSSEDFFVQKKAKLMMKAGKSSVAEYVEVTKENLKKHAKEKVEVKIMSAEDKEDNKSSYIVVNNKATVPKEQLLAALTNGAAPLNPKTSLPVVSNGTYNL